MKKFGLLLLFTLLVSGCEASVGDKCTTSNDCPTGTVCDTDSPGGYCLVANCEGDEDCPEDTVCVKFGESQNFCLLECSKNGDCRGGDYVCRDDIGEKKFCYIRADYPYGRDENNEIPFQAPAE